MKTEFVAVRGEMREGFEAIERRFEKVDELDAYRMTMGFCGLMLAALIGLSATQI